MSGMLSFILLLTLVTGVCLQLHEATKNDAVGNQTEAFGILMVVGLVLALVLSIIALVIATPCIRRCCYNCGMRITPCLQKKKTTRTPVVHNIEVELAAVTTLEKTCDTSVASANAPIETTITIVNVVESKKEDTLVL